MIIDGNAIAEMIQQEIKATVDAISTRKPCLAVIQVGDHPASSLYIRRKVKACSAVGILSIRRHLPHDVAQEQLLLEIDQLNADTSVDGILVQLPLPAHIDPLVVVQRLDPNKDVDAFHPINLGKLLMGDLTGFIPCTPLGIKVLLERSGIALEGKNVVIVGRSNIVGKPLAALLMQNRPDLNATVTVAHSRSSNLKEHCARADILVVAIGNRQFVGPDMVKEGAIVIDVGINQLEDATKKSGYRLVGDVDFDQVYEKSGPITPVPGGVGPMTIAMLLNNTLLSYQRRMQKP